ncbi:hypothetical protein ALC60_10813 [Trachymyrmex zeteki]|uniref:MADF domain-containing protein n=1 Tax=Mycetomoellerius zeteki TaxID=64791 RepID=A0A151WQL1_9HYME|nr:hypothetical protein ALC60_10813 [Trachymyrmex zeteki]
MDTEYQSDIEFDESSEVQIVTYRTLINLVKANPVLYEKHHKGYNKRSDKLLMWNRIGISLIPPMTEKEFYRLRQKFGKERRKVLQSQPRSGASGNDVSYKSNWILYNDLMFLADHIQPRQ